MRSESERCLQERRVIFTTECHGRLVVVEDVPARVDSETGERLFSPETVEQLQSIVWSGCEPDRMAQVPVYRFR